MNRDMDDSSMFLQWAMNQLQQHPTAAAGAPAYPDGGGGGSADGAGGREREAAFPSLQALRNAYHHQPAQTAAAAVRVQDLTVQVDHHRTNSSSWSSGDISGAAMDYDAEAGWSPHTARARTTILGGSSNSWPVSWNFSAASAQATTDDGRRGGDVPLPDATVAARALQPSTGRRGGSSGPAAAAAASSSSPRPVQDHIIAERRRREKINQRFIELSTVIPGLKKMDKATILGDAVNYVRGLQDKVKTLEKDSVHVHGAGGTIQSTVKKPCSIPDNEVAASDGSNGDDLQKLPEIEARLSDQSVLLRIHCVNTRGLLVKVLSEVEMMSLVITHTNVMPFPSSTAIITITAKMEESFNTTVDEIVRRINSVLHQYYSNNT